MSPKVTGSTSISSSAALRVALARITWRAVDQIGFLGGGGHDVDGLLHRWWVRRVAEAFVARWPAVMEAGQRRRGWRQSAILEWCGFDEILLRTRVLVSLPA
jgi:hypothetical protein